MTQVLEEIRETFLTSIDHRLFGRYGLGYEFVRPESPDTQSLEVDVRLKDPEFRCKSLMFKVFRDSDGEPCFISTFFSIDNELLPRIAFWQNGPSACVLRRVKLIDILSDQQKRIITFGYTATRQSSFQGKTILTYAYLRAAKALLRLPSIAAYIEVTGSVSLEPSVQLQEEIMLGSQDAGISQLGVTREASLTTEHFAAFLNMSHKNLYHLRTLGKVYVYNLP